MSGASLAPTPSAPPDAPDLVLRLDVHNEHAVAYLRLTGAVVCGLGALTIGALGPTLFGWVIVGVAALASLGWTAAFVAARRRTAVPTTYSLSLGAAALELREAGRTETVPWSAIRAAVVDEDRLVVLVHRLDTETPLVLEPRYEGTSVYALCDLVARRVTPAASQALPTP